jgi:hypothetical protein
MKLASIIISGSPNLKGKKKIKTKKKINPKIFNPSLNQ